MQSDNKKQKSADATTGTGVLKLVHTNTTIAEQFIITTTHTVGQPLALFHYVQLIIYNM